MSPSERSGAAFALDVFNQAKSDAGGGEQLADLAAPEGRRAVFIGRETRNLDHLARLAPLDGLALTGVRPELAAGIVRTANPRRLWLVGLRLDSLDLLDPLDRLEALCLEDLTRVTDLRPVARHAGLALLSLKGMTRVTTIAPIAGLAGLRALEITTGSPVAKGLNVDLGAVASLEGLEILHVGGTRSPDLSTEPLAGLPKLRDLDIGGDWPVAELARLAARYPHIEARWLKPFVVNAEYRRGTVSQTIYDVDPADHPEAEITYDATGLRKPYGLHPERDAERIAKLRAEWEAHVAAWRAEYEMAD